MRAVSIISLILLVAITGSAEEGVEEVRWDLAQPKLLRISGRIDGTGRFIVTRDSARYENKLWKAPSSVRFDGQAWARLDKAPSRWGETARGLDLTRAWVVERSGRDTIAMEHTADGFDIYVADGPSGAADYSITIAIPRR